MTNLNDWYWSGVPGVYGSARGGMVPSPATDADYLAWQASRKSTTPWPTDSTGAATPASLDAVLALAGLPVTGLTPPSTAQLLAYSNAKLNGLIATARTYSGNAGSVRADASTATQADLLGLAVWGAANPSATMPWVDDFGVVAMITGAQVVALGQEVLAYGQATYALLASAAEGIASGAITATAQVDALAWPV